MRLKSNACQNPDTKNPFTIVLASSTSSALMTNVNSPRVRIVIGRVSKRRIGLINTLSSPSTSATSKAVQSPPIETPGKIYPAIIIASAVMIHRAKRFILSTVPQGDLYSHSNPM